MTPAPEFQIEMLPFALPRLSGGLYEASFELEVEGVVGGKYAHKQSFHVSAPRFVLPLDAIKGLYPARNSKGAFEHTFPHITFQHKTLPWERDLFGTHGADTPMPWMCLLLLDEDELRDPAIQLTSLQVADLGFQDVLPFEEHTQDGPVMAQLLTLPGSKFLEIFAGREHLHKLAHVRKTSMTHKEHGSTYDDGEYAMLVCNRLPLASKTNQVFLVSLEGIPAEIATTDAVRLVVLHSWTFHAQGTDFQTLTQHLKTDWLRADAEVPAIAAKSHEETMIDSQLATGLVPVYYKPHATEPTLAWYRGPLAPFLPELDQDLMRQSKALPQMHAASGMLDITYAAAYELGKMLALQNPAYLQALQAWENKRSAVQEVLEMHKPMPDPFKIAEADRAEKSPALLDFLRQNEILQEMLLDYWDRLSPNSP